MGLMLSNSIRINGVPSLMLTETVEINVERDDQTWCLSISQLNASGCGYSINEALGNIKREHPLCVLNIREGT
jgi:hypothetical protein